jgi:hypothetical protein
LTLRGPQKKWTERDAPVGVQDDDGKELAHHSVASPCRKSRQVRFREVSAGEAMAGVGWLAEWQVLNEASAKVEATRTVCGVPVLHALGTTPRAK